LPYSVARAYDLGQKGVEPGRDGAEQARQIRSGRAEESRAREEVVSGQEAAGEDAQLTAGDQDDAGAVPAKVLRASGAFGEQRQHLFGGQVARERGEPHLESDVGRMLTRYGQPVRVGAGDPHRGAVQVARDDLHSRRTIEESNASRVHPPDRRAPVSKLIPLPRTRPLRLRRCSEVVGRHGTLSSAAIPQRPADQQRDGADVQRQRQACRDVDGQEVDEQ
jgi:hypothetical protein